MYVCSILMVIFHVNQVNQFWGNQFPIFFLHLFQWHRPYGCHPSNNVKAVKNKKISDLNQAKSSSVLIFYSSTARVPRKGHCYLTDASTPREKKCYDVVGTTAFIGQMVLLTQKQQQ